MFIAAVVIALLGARVLGALSVPDGLLRDLCTLYAPITGHMPEAILLVEHKESDAPLRPGQVAELATRMCEAGAQRVVLLAHGLLSQADMLHLQPLREQVLVGRPAYQPSLGAPYRYWGEVPDYSVDLPIVPMVAPPSDHGVHRRQFAQVAVEGQGWVPTVEYVAAGRTGFPPDNTFGVNFTGSISSIPAVRFHHFRTEGWAPQLVRGRTVLVALEVSPLDSLSTPITPGSPGMAAALFRAYALATLLEFPVHEIESPSMIALLTLLVLVLGLVLFQSGTRKTALRAFVLFSALIGVCAWALFWIVSTWIPATEMLLANTAMFGFVLAARQTLEERQARKILLDSAHRARLRLLPSEPHAADDPWSMVVAMVQNALDLTRTLFLERVEGEHRLREIKALGCSLSDVHERRRDYERTPYSTAISRNAALRIDANRHYLRPLDLPEVQYLVPLVFGGRVCGFWAFGIDPDHREEVPDFDMIVESFQEEIADLLFKRFQWQQSRKRRLRKLGNLLSVEVGSRLPRELNFTFESLNRRLELLDHLFDSMSTGTALYDLFGRLLHVNRRMSELLRTQGLAANQMSAADLAAALTGRPPRQMRQVFRGILLDRQSFHCSIHQREPKQTLTLMIRPVSRQDAAETVERHVGLRIFGFLFELNDATQMGRQMQLKEKVLANVNYKLRNDLQVLSMASALLEEEEDPREIKDIIQMLGEKSLEVSAFLERAQTALGDDGLEETVARYPVDGVEITKLAVSLCEAELLERGLNIVSRIPEVPTLFWAHHDTLLELLQAMLRYLGADAVEQSDLRVEWSDDAETVLIQLWNQGFGLPEAHFQALLEGREETDSRPLQTVRRVRSLVESWGATLRGRSGLGVGTAFELRLKRFI